MKIDLNRRSWMKTTAAVAAAGAFSALTGRSAQAATDDEPEIKPEINIAGYDYDRVRAIMDGAVGVPGSDVAFDVQNIYDLNQFAFGPERKYTVTEIGLIPYITKYLNEDFRDYTLIPVFISRIFRHRNLFVHADAGIETPSDLRGKRVGTPGYGMSAATWIRGFLLDEYGVKADEMQWIETTKSLDAGTLDKGFSNYFFADAFPLVHGPPGVDESELLLNGDFRSTGNPVLPSIYSLPSFCAKKTRRARVSEFVRR